MADISNPYETAANTLSQEQIENIAKTAVTGGVQTHPWTMSDIARETGLSSIEPNIAEDIKNKEWIDAVLKFTGTAGDVGTVVGTGMMATGAGAPVGAAVVLASQVAKRASNLIKANRLKKRFDIARQEARKESDDIYGRERLWPNVELDEPVTDRHIEKFLQDHGYGLKEPGVKKTGDTYDFIGDKIVAYTSHANKTGFSQKTFEAGIPFNDLYEWMGY